MSPDASSLVVLPEWFMQMGLMAWPLAVCSILALAVGLERLVFLARSMIAQKSRYNRLAAYLTEHQHHPKPLRDELAGVALNDLKTSYYSGIKLLRLIGMISPIIGLLGTILGIISAFRVISVQTGPVAPSLIADGLWEAMMTTAAGLMIALPALLMAHFFSAFSDRQLDRFCQDLNRLSLSFELVSHRKRSQVVELNAEARRS